MLFYQKKPIYLKMLLSMVLKPSIACFHLVKWILKRLKVCNLNIFIWKDYFKKMKLKLLSSEEVEVIDAACHPGQITPLQLLFWVFIQTWFLRDAGLTYSRDAVND